MTNSNHFSGHQITTYYEQFANENTAPYTTNIKSDTGHKTFTPCDVCCFFQSASVAVLVKGNPHIPT